MRVTVIQPDGGRRLVELRGDRLTVGRSRQCDIRLADMYVSRTHAEFLRTPGGWAIRDAGSRSGTLVNGARISAPAALREGDIIQLGSSKIVLGEGPAAAAAIVIESEQSLESSTILSYRAADQPPDAWARIVVAAVRELAQKGPSDVTLADILRMAVEAVGGERGVLAVIDDGGRLQVKATFPYAHDEPITIPRTVRQRVARAGEALYVEDVRDDEELAQAQSVMDQGIRSIYCAPLGEAAQAHGLLYIDARSHRTHFRRSRLELVATLASFAGIAIEFEQARRAAEKSRRLQAQLEAAAEIQERLLPGRHPGLPPGFLASAHHHACETVGGDLYDIWRQEESAGVMVADVAGKGLSAALITASLHAAWCGSRSAGLPPERWLERVNAQLLPLLPDNRFATLGFAITEPESDTIRIAGAGHTPAILLAKGVVSLVPSSAPALGLFPDFESETVARPFRPGDLLLLYSDGALDQRDRSGRPFGEERLLALVREHGTDGPQALIDAIVRALRAHADGSEQDDDLTLVALARR